VKTLSSRLRAPVLALLPIAATACALAAPHAARAALVSSAMTYTGSTGCPASEAAQVTILADTGESHTWGTPTTVAPFSPGSPGDYKMTFSYIPLGGVGGTAWVRCATGGFTQRVFLPRPLFDDSARVDLGS
jgi:hypothetical protein